MNSARKSMILLILSILASILLFVIDYAEDGLQRYDFAGPVFVIGTLGIPSIIDLVKIKKIRQDKNSNKSTSEHDK